MECAVWTALRLFDHTLAPNVEDGGVALQLRCLLLALLFLWQSMLSWKRHDNGHTNSTIPVERGLGHLAIAGLKDKERNAQPRKENDGRERKDRDGRYGVHATE